MVQVWSELQDGLLSAAAKVLEHCTLTEAEYKKVRQVSRRAAWRHSPGTTHGPLGMLPPRRVAGHLRKRCWEAAR